MPLLMMLSWKDHVVMIHSLMEDLNSPGQSVDGDSLSIEKIMCDVLLIWDDFKLKQQLRGKTESALTLLNTHLTLVKSELLEHHNYWPKHHLILKGACFNLCVLVSSSRSGFCPLHGRGQRWGVFTQSWIPHLWACLCLWTWPWRLRKLRPCSRPSALPLC